MHNRITEIERAAENDMEEKIGRILACYGVYEITSEDARVRARMRRRIAREILAKIAGIGDG